MIISWAKNMGVTTEHVLYEMSYANLVIYSAATPHYDDEKWDSSKDANDIDNFKNLDDEVFV